MIKADSDKEVENSKEVLETEFKYKIEYLLKLHELEMARLAYRRESDQVSHDNEVKRMNIKNENIIRQRESKTW